MKVIKNEKGHVDAGALAGFVLIAFGIACIAAWFTHVFTCISQEAWWLLIAGAIMFPIAIIHGFGIWFSFF